MSAQYSPQSARHLAAQLAAGHGAEFYFSGPEVIAARSHKTTRSDSVDALLEREEVTL
ncbi:hypothetical protein [Zhihengliuella salsuginis]|uniref:Uncharacterized protein n=1 Tax=Zhihengliuella salsuginis TaxID=578222 RepID=A0ABQ3GLF0_9MICC|nr:hypothetical protein [Zhihengliuella salsuginis]GHD11428.1 hypothetical protein GCM10008096_26050 [Zhihengliuella salsuginis]